MPCAVRARPRHHLPLLSPSFHCYAASQALGDTVGPLAQPADSNIMVAARAALAPQPDNTFVPACRGRHTAERVCILPLGERGSTGARFGPRCCHRLLPHHA